ncbi:MAG: IclR family transcriptional regulator [Alphaproteobacteria bacterium]|nr:IclR family transcriptional regulator [Alphaproteobacteria bacterium]
MTEYKNQSLERGFQILEFLDSSPSGRAVSEVARATGLHRATAHRLLEVLCSLGYAYKAEDRRYWIGYAMHVFGHPASVMSRMKHHAHPFLLKLAHEVDETANLAFLEGIQAFIVDRVSTESAHRSDVQIGGYFDAHATSMGKALLSMRSNHEVQASYKATRLNAYTGTTITDINGLLRELAEIRKRGYAVNNEERSPGIRSVAAPLVNPHGRANFAIAVTGPRARLNDARIPRIGARLQEVAKEIRDQLIKPIESS